MEGIVPKHTLEATLGEVGPHQVLRFIGRSEPGQRKARPRRQRVRSARSRDDDVADLDDRGEICVVRDVRHDLFGMRAEARLEGLNRVAEDVGNRR